MTIVREFIGSICFTGPIVHKEEKDGSVQRIMSPSEHEWNDQENDARIDETVTIVISPDEKKKQR